jgi:hypothetical protein
LKKKARENSKLVKVREESKGKEKNTDYLDLSNTFLAK